MVKDQMKELKQILKRLKMHWIQLYYYVGLKFFCFIQTANWQRTGTSCASWKRPGSSPGPWAPERSVLPTALPPRLRGVEYNDIRIVPERNRIGLIAQEVELIIPEVVRTSEEDGSKWIEYQHLVVLIEAIKEQQNK